MLDHPRIRSWIIEEDTSGVSIALNQIQDFFNQRKIGNRFTEPFYIHHPTYIHNNPGFREAVTNNEDARSSYNAIGTASRLVPDLDPSLRILTQAFALGNIIEIVNGMNESEDKRTLLGLLNNVDKEEFLYTLEVIKETGDTVTSQLGSRMEVNDGLKRIENREYLGSLIESAKNSQFTGRAQNSQILVTPEPVPNSPLEAAQNSPNLTIEVYNQGILEWLCALIQQIFTFKSVEQSIYANREIKLESLDDLPDLEK